MPVRTQEIRDDAEMHRFELEFLAASRRFGAHVASEDELPALVELTVQHLPGVAKASQAIFEVHRKSSSVLAITRNAELVGGAAVLALNKLGFEALLDDRLSVANPDLSLLCGPNEAVTAIYAWALCVPGPVVAAMGQIMDWLRQPRFIGRDIFGCPGSIGGQHFMRKIGFQSLGQTLGGQPLSVYRRRIVPNGIQGDGEYGGH